MTAEDLRKSILQQAIQGKLVPQDPNDEPASELLSKIRAEKERLIKEKKIKRDKNETIIYRGEDNSYYEKILATGEVKCIDDEIPFEIPDSWEWARINSVYLINPKNKSNDELSAAFIPMEKIDAIYTSSYSYDIVKWGKIKSGFTHFADGDVGFAKITPCFQNRKSAVFDNLPNGIGAGTTELKILRSYGHLIHNYYLLFFLETPYFVDNAKFKGTANQQRIISGYLELKLFPIPPYKEQIQIVNRVKELFSLIDIYQTIKHNLDILEIELSQKLRSSILQYAIQGRLVKQEESDGTAFDLLEQIQKEKAELVTKGKLKKSELKYSVIFRGDDNKYWEKKDNELTCIDDEIPFDIPDSWQWVRLGNFVTVIGGYAFKSSDLRSPNGYRVIRISDISESGLINKNIVRYGGGLELNQYKLRQYDILLAMTGGTVGKSLLLDMPLKEVLYLNQRVAAIRCEWLYYGYIDLFLKSSYIKSIIDKRKNSTNDNISMNDINNFLMPLPPLNEQHRICNRYKEIASIMRK